AWTQAEIQTKLKNAGIILQIVENDYERIHHRKTRQLDLLKQCPALFPAHAQVTDLTNIVRCQKKKTRGKWLVEGQIFHDKLERRFQSVDILFPNRMVSKADVERIITEMCSVQVREQTVDDPAISTRGRIDHLLLDETGFVIRDDKTSRNKWYRCYPSSIFQVHVYAFIISCMYPHLPCRALQIHVHRKWGDSSQIFTFTPAWEWFFPLFAHALLTCWGLIPM
ncbi:MAG: hypothetical protein ACFFBD_03625, partial [Candidatus Hodarchaeota archaeon]